MTRMILSQFLDDAGFMTLILAETQNVVEFGVTRFHRKSIEAISDPEFYVNTVALLITYPIVYNMNKISKQS